MQRLWSPATSGDAAVSTLEQLADSSLPPARDFCIDALRVEAIDRFWKLAVKEGLGLSLQNGRIDLMCEAKFQSLMRRAIDELQFLGHDSHRLFPFQVMLETSRGAYIIVLEGP